MAKTELKSKPGQMSMPEGLRIVFGSPPLVRYEDRRTYETLMAQVTASIAPSDTIEWLLFKDVVDSSWDILRYRRLKAALIDSYIRSDLESKLSIPPIPGAEIEEMDTFMPVLGIPRVRRPSEEELKGIRKNREEIIEKRSTNPYFAGGPPGDEEIYARALIEEVDKITAIEVLLTSAERRRNAALNQIDRHRERAGAYGQASSSRIIDGDFQDIASPANRRSKQKKSA